MTKARTKAARRRSKRRITLAGGEAVPQPAAQGRRSDLEPREPADAVALAARARLTGCSVEEARDVLASDDMGRCIRWAVRDDRTRRELLDVWQGLSASWHNYATRCLSLTTTPQAASLPMLPNPMQTDPSLRVDLRTAEERDEAARNSWFAWLDDLMALPSENRHALRGHLQGYGAPVWDADRARPTAGGRLAVKALSSLHEMRT